jgi:hypothetical protein
MRLLAQGCFDGLGRAHVAEAKSRSQQQNSRTRTGVIAIQASIIRHYATAHVVGSRAWQF